jgi:hypothetical protein
MRDYSKYNYTKISNFENRNSMLIFLIPFILVLFGCKKIASPMEESKAIFESWQYKSNSGGFSGAGGNTSFNSENCQE